MTDLERYYTEAAYREAMPCSECGKTGGCEHFPAAANIATDDHRYIISTPWGDWAYADTRAAAIVARRQLAQDARDYDINPDASIDDVTILDRGEQAPLAA